MTVSPGMADVGAFVPGGEIVLSRWAKGPFLDLASR